VPGYPVYYAPRASSNYFFYDGLYWVYADDNWYESSWYNGPWELVGPEYVPFFLLRVPVRYYRRPPSYFRGWRASSAPRWGEHWGHDWERRRSGWDRWDRHSVPAPAPLPVYQRQYSGDRYPRVVEQQRSIQSQSYRYQPREAVTQQHLAAPRDAAPRDAAPRETRRDVSPPPERRQVVTQERRHAGPPPQQQQTHQAPPPPQERHVVVQPAPQNRGQERKAEARDNGHGDKPQKQNHGQEKKNERGQDRN
jgi:hypothetical protein